MTNRRSSRIEPDTTVEVKKARCRVPKPHVSNMKMGDRVRSHRRARDQQVHVQRMLDLTAWPPAFTSMVKTDERAGCDRGKAQITEEAGNSARKRASGGTLKCRGPAERTNSSKSEGQEGARA
jgi:hypothetical protein